jgi:hypothetical protein
MEMPKPGLTLDRMDVSEVQVLKYATDCSKRLGPNRICGVVSAGPNFEPNTDTMKFPVVGPFFNDNEFMMGES